jgi:hypothetical protein
VEIAAQDEEGDVTVYLWALYRPHVEPKKGFGDLDILFAG